MHWEEKCNLSFKNSKKRGSCPSAENSDFPLGKRKPDKKTSTFFCKKESSQRKPIGGRIFFVLKLPTPSHGALEKEKIRKKTNMGRRD